MAKPLELPIPYKRTTLGHLDHYFGGGGVAYANKQEAYSAIDSRVRQGKTFGVWETDPDTGVTEIIQYSWSEQGKTGNGEEIKIGKGGVSHWEDILEKPFDLWTERQYDASSEAQVNFESWLHIKFLDTGEYFDGIFLFWTQHDQTYWDQWIINNNMQGWDFEDQKSHYLVSGDPRFESWRIGGFGINGEEDFQNSPDFINLRDSWVLNTPFSYIDYKSDPQWKLDYEAWLLNADLDIEDWLDAIVNEVTQADLSDNNYTDEDKQKVSALSLVFVGYYPTVAELEISHPVGTSGQFAWVNAVPPAEGYVRYIWSSANSQWEVGNQSGFDVFDKALTAKLFGGKTFGKYENGDPILGPGGVDTIGRTATEIIEWALSDVSYPSYSAPSAGLSIGPQSSTLEIGETVDVVLNPNFVQRDAGSSTGVIIYKDNVNIGTTDPLTDSNVTVSEVPIEYHAEYNYLQGVLKKDSDGQDYPTGRIDAGSVQSPKKSIRGYMRIFYGASATIPNNSTQARALPQTILDNGSTNKITLNTGTTHVNFSVLLPIGKTIQSSIDLDALSQPMDYVLVDSSFVVNDPNGDPHIYNKYVLSQSIPNSSNHRHEIIFG